MPQLFQYYVEGETDAALLRALKTEMQCIVPGKIKVFNAVEEEFTRARLITLKHKTNVVLLFDTDTLNASILKKNIKFLSNQSMINHVYCLPQVNNLEDELIRSCNISRIKELLSSKTDTDFKTDFCKCTAIKQSLERHDFSINRLWTKHPLGIFTGIPNDSVHIKKPRH